MTRTTFAAAAAVVVGLAFPGTGHAARSAGEIRPAATNAIADSYLVVLRSGAGTDRLVSLANSLGGRVGHVYRAAVNGFEVSLPEATARRIAAHPDVSYVEQNAWHVVPDAAAMAPQPNPPSWGLDRIDQRSLPLDNLYDPPNTGAGVRVYVFGTGIRFTHADFGGRAVSGRDVIDNDNDASDCNGLSTHLAGTVGGAAYGVAKGVTMVAVRNVNCAGSASIAQVVAGIDWVTANAVKPAAALMTLGGPVSATFDNAVRASIASGLSYVVSAGSSNSDACNFSPGRVPEAFTVSATDRTDTRASFANFGPCLDIFAPGVSITSAWYTSDTAVSTISGTSTAAAHAAGAAALLLRDNPLLTPAQVSAALIADATPGVVLNPGTGSPNRLLFVGAGLQCGGTSTVDVSVPEYPGPAVTFAIAIAGCGGPASATSSVEVHAVHTARGNLRVELVAPDGTVYLLQAPSSDTADDLHLTYEVNLSGEARDGNWRLRLRDRRAGNVGFLDSWTLTL